SYIEMLKKLDNDYRTSLSTCQGDTIIVNHNAFSYLANNYNFNVEALSGLSPEAQPSAKNMIKLIEHVKEHNISTIFFESFVSDKAIKNIAAEAKVSVDVLQPLGNITADEADKNLTFEDIMRMNLEKISKAMKCQ
ncbi:MAG: zinc ABC transporter substrate-binding protein, partial [Sulfurimonas sp.]|nr:zinc ABC transporter substrate-binding protein [Sulfurimonas sp.]